MIIYVCMFARFDLHVEGYLYIAMSRGEIFADIRDVKIFVCIACL